MKFHIEYWVVIPDIYISDISDNCVKVITKVCSNHDNHPIMGPEKKNIPSLLRAYCAKKYWGI